MNETIDPTTLAQIAAAERIREKLKHETPTDEELKTLRTGVQLANETIAGHAKRQRVGYMGKRLPRSTNPKGSTTMAHGGRQSSLVVLRRFPNAEV